MGSVGAAESGNLIVLAGGDVDRVDNDQDVGRVVEHIRPGTGARRPR